MPNRTAGKWKSLLQKKEACQAQPEEDRGTTEMNQPIKRGRDKRKMQDFEVQEGT